MIIKSSPAIAVTRTKQTTDQVPLLTPAFQVLLQAGANTIG